MTHSGQIGVYIHWPFCLSKCPYCDFNVHVRESIDHARWRDAYVRALESYAEMTQGRVVSSVFFGGGTPSTMEPASVRAIIDAVHRLWPCGNDLEITLEANPTSIEAAKFAAFKEAGVNRVSVGVQALNDADLKFLGRTHDEGQARAAIDIARDTFDRFSFDLIYARPNQTLNDWRQELEMAAKLSAGHLSLYQLTIERNTPFYFDEQQGKFSVPEEDLGADFYMLTQEVLAQGGLPAYEVSNHAALGEESRHNMIYWRYGDYIGIGPGAHGRLSLESGKVSTRGHHAPDKWLEWVEQNGHGAHPFTPLSPQDRFKECLMMGLRVAEGLPLERLDAQLGEGGGAWRKMLNTAKMDALAGEGWLSFSDEQMVLNAEGRMRLNAIIPYILK